MSALSPEDRRLLSEGISAILGKQGVRGNSIGGYPAPADSTWTEFAELGILALGLPEEMGGLGLGFEEFGSIMHTLGRFACVEPFVETVVLSAGVVRRSPNELLKAQVLPALASGQMKISLGFAEPGSRYALDSVSTSATKDGGGWVLNGHKAVVLGAPRADRLIISARLSGGTSGPAGIALFMVDPSVSGVTVRGYHLIDGREAGEVHLEGVKAGPAELLVGPREGLAVLEWVADEATVALCHEAVGAMERLNELAMEHCRERIAFGQAIAKNQVIQHRLVDMQVAFEHASAVTDSASEAVAGADPTHSRAIVSAAKVAVNRESKFIGEAAVHLHGAGGTTEDFDVGRYFKRLIVNSMLFGDTDHHLQRFLDTRRSSREEQ